MNSGRINLAEELGRIDNETMNSNRKAEKTRVISELNKGYKNGGNVRGCGIAKKGFNKSIMKS